MVTTPAQPGLCSLFAMYKKRRFHRLFLYIARAIAACQLFEGNSPKNGFLSVIVGLRPTITLKIISLLGLNWHDAIALYTSRDYLCNLEQ